MGEESQKRRRRRSNSVSHLRAGLMLGSYRLIRLLGEGGSGRVFLAEHTCLGRHVAIKVPHASKLADPEALARFFQEARTVNQIHHENIVQITDFVEHGRIRYLVMEYVAGPTLADLIGGCTMAQLSLERRLSIAVQIAAGLAAAHRAGVVHRDLKPANIIVTRRGDRRDFVKLLDFGVAKLCSGLDPSTPPDAVVETTVGIVFGTPGFMAPEQMDGKPVDARADIYAFGALAYLLFSGRPAFDASTVAQLLFKHMSKRPEPMRRLTHLPCAMPRELDALVLRCLAKHPHQRPQSMEEVTEILSSVLARTRLESRTTAQPGQPEPAAPSRWWLRISLALTALLIGTAIGLVTIFGLERATAALAAPGKKRQAIIAPPITVLPAQLETSDSVQPPSEGGEQGPACGGHYAKARRYLQRKKTLLAIRVLNRCIAEDPGFAPAHRTLGIAEIVVGRRYRADRALRRFLELAPGHPDAARVRRILARDRPSGRATAAAR